MNLEDLVDESGLQQDEWSLTKPVFGKEDQLQVVGWSGFSGSNKFYILICNKCSQDLELFGNGNFRSTKSNLTMGRTPCACAHSPRWTKEQYTIICNRQAEKLGVKFDGFVDDHPRGRTKLKLVCNKHGMWCTATILSFVHQNASCPKCGDERVSEKATGRPSPLRVVKDTEEILQDAWTLTSPVAGKDNHLRVVGWKGKVTMGGNMVKSYLVECKICARDTELFPNPIFTTTKDDFISGVYPCGCGKIPKWDERQWHVRCQREALRQGYKFLGFEGKFLGNKTKLSLVCPQHGSWKTTVASNFFSGNSCPECGGQSQRTAYINLVLDNNNAVALKFGIAKILERRVQKQNRLSAYTVENYVSYKFTSSSDCRAAELECKQVLDCGVISKQEMLDGYTETTYVCNLDKIIQIYKKHGGVKL